MTQRCFILGELLGTSSLPAAEDILVLLATDTSSEMVHDGKADSADDANGSSREQNR